MPVKKAAKKIKGLSRFTKLNIIVFTLLFAGIGTYLVINSKAASETWGVITVKAVNTTTGAPIAGTGIYVSAIDASHNLMSTTCYTQDQTTTQTASNGLYVGYTSSQGIANRQCRISTAGATEKLYKFWQALPAGWRYDGYNLAGDNQVGVSQPDKDQGIFWLRSNNPVITIYTTPPGCGTGTLNNQCPSDSDGDGIVDSSDHCPSLPYGGNGGCPPAAGWIKATPNSISSGGSVTLSFDWVYASACSIPGITGNLPNKNPVTVPNITTTPSITFSLRCESQYSFGIPVSVFNTTVAVAKPNTCPAGYSGTYPNCVAPPQPCPAGYTGTSQPNCTPPKTTSPPPRIVPRTGGTAPAGASDQERPSVPANLQAEQTGNGEVDLTWDASTDNVGVVGYTVERSTDGTNWEMLSDSVTDTNYADNTAEFNTKYSYRVSSFDAAGNYSDYAVVDLNTNAFAPNVYADQDSTITSDDGIVTVNIPAGALKEDAYCEITKDGVNSKPKGYKLVAGAYTIDCKNAKGDSITSFEKEATVIMDLKDFKQYKKFAAYAIDGNNLSNLNATFNSKDKTLTFKMTEFQTFAAYGAKGSSLWWLWLLIILLIAGLIFFIIRLRRSGGSDDSYYDTTNYVTMPPTEPVGPAGPQQHTSLPDMVAQGQQPPQGYPQDPYAQQPQQYGQPPAGPGAEQQPPQYPGSDQQYPPQYPPQA